MNRLFEIGKFYRFRVKDAETGTFSIYHGEVLHLGDTLVKIRDAKGRIEFLEEKDIKTRTNEITADYFYSLVEKEREKRR